MTSKVVVSSLIAFVALDSELEFLVHVACLSQRPRTVVVGVANSLQFPSTGLNSSQSYHPFLQDGSCSLKLVLKSLFRQATRG